MNDIEQKLYQLIKLPDDNQKDVIYVEQFMWMPNWNNKNVKHVQQLQQFMWMNATDFYVYVKYEYMQIFMEKCQELFGCKFSCEILFNKKDTMSNTAICVNLSSILESCNTDITKQIDLNNMFHNAYREDYCKVIITEKIKTALEKKQIKHENMSLEWSNDTQTVQVSLDDEVYDTFNYGKQEFEHVNQNKTGEQKS